MDTTSSARMTHEGGAVYRLDVTGLLRKADLDRCQSELARAIERAGPVKLFVVLDRFEGWSQRDDWSGLDFYATYGDRIARVAIVGDERWRSEMLMFAVAGLRQAPVEYFALEATAQARAWLNA